jgi:hypothetical protein
VPVTSKAPTSCRHGERKLIKIHIQAVAEATQVATNEELCWLAIAAATAWLPKREPAGVA